MRERYEELLILRHSDADVELPAIPTPPQKRFTRRDGDASYANIARALGMSRNYLGLCRSGKRRWPEGKREQFEQFATQRADAA